jgi:hypothetical protein
MLNKFCISNDSAMQFYLKYYLKFNHLKIDLWEKQKK